MYTNTNINIVEWGYYPTSNIQSIIYPNGCMILIEPLSPLIDSTLCYLFNIFVLSVHISKNEENGEYFTYLIFFNMAVNIKFVDRK